MTDTTSLIRRYYDAFNAKDWDGMLAKPPPRLEKSTVGAEWDATANAVEGGIRREPALPEHEDIALAPVPARNEFEFDDRPDDSQANNNQRLAERMRANARRAALDPNDGIEL